MITNAHIHTFTDRDVPVKFLPLRLVWLFRIFGGVLTKIMKVILPSERDILHRYASFIITGRLGSQKKIFEAVAKEYPPNTQFFVLTMDMAFMGAGGVPRPYDEQVREICELSRENRNIKVFIHVDPRRPGVLQMLKDFHKCYGIAGIKIYPPLGYAPNHPVLLECYEYCERKGLAVVTHCSPSNPVRFKGKMEELYKLLDDAGIYYDKKMSRAELCALFTNPRNWIEIAIKYPNLPIDLAHLGSADEMKKWLKDEANNPNNWLNIIRNECLKKHKNLFSDTSFTFYEDKFIDVLKTVVMADKEINGQIMFGTDYYMNETKTNEREYVIGIRRKIGEENFKLISETNINRFLKYKFMKEDKTTYTEITDTQVLKEINDIEEVKEINPFIKANIGMRKINHIVIHCTATSQDISIKSICKYWNEILKWNSPGYHFIIEANGTLHNLLPIEKVANGVKGYNEHSIHISYIGGIDKNKKAIDNRTDDQKMVMRKIVNELKIKFPDAEILGHRDFPNVKKDCPCFDVKKEFK